VSRQSSNGPRKGFQKTYMRHPEMAHIIYGNNISQFFTIQKNLANYASTKTNRFLYFSPLGCSCCAKKLSYTTLCVL
jgi:hypothetical protein